MGALRTLNCGVKIFDSKRFDSDKGSVLHGVKKSNEGFSNFGEVYFSSVSKGVVKGWKKHQIMEMNLVVPVGTIRFYFKKTVDSEPDIVVVGKKNYKRLYVPAMVWMAFEGIDDSLNLLMNCASIEHDPNEALLMEFI